MSKLGLHIIMPHDEPGYRDDITSIPLPALKVVGNPEQVGILKNYAQAAALKNTVFVGRVYDWDKEAQIALERGDTPEDIADRFVEHLSNLLDPTWPSVYWECGPNEPGDQYILQVSRYYSHIIPKLANLGIRSVAFNFSVCHPLPFASPEDAYNGLAEALRAIDRVGPGLCVVGLHQYGLHGSMRDYADARVLRHEKIPQLRNKKIIFTEGGQDEPAYKLIPWNAEQYLNELFWLDDRLCEAPNVIATCIYTLDHEPGWENYSIVGPVAERLFAYLKAPKPPIVEVHVPIPAPTPAPAPDGLRVNAPNGLNVRLRPSTAAYKVGSLANGTPVRLTGEKSGAWVVIEYPVKTWVHSDYLK